ncbi:uncharacterized protein LOC133525136 [Cydia pomonella]|uniref:uncharacterized protein LOC133525136 n=1 Tax=Cydia pomonella TaxID=82600 RepID=UPI002ADE5F6D|nr:uncharacterized protein LOC133525136 [Cydia pomonella]XP_061717380.1 uncharacterized protein LOC133525136 [Cydia pomonella]
MADSRHIEKWFERSEMYQSNVIELMSSEYEAGTSQPKRRRLKRRLVELLPSSRSTPVTSQTDNQVTEEIDSESTRDVAPSRVVSPALNQVQANGNEAPERYTNFYRFLMTTVILDDLSFREPFISAADANQLTEEDLILHGVRLYLNAHQLSPQELVNLPFIPREMVTGETMKDFPFLDPFLVVLWDFDIDDVHWMLNILPWRVVDRHIRTGRSILHWIVGIGNIHQFLETTRAPLSITVKILRFLDNYFE